MITHHILVAKRTVNDAWGLLRYLSNQRLANAKKNNFPRWF